MLTFPFSVFFSFPSPLEAPVKPKKGIISLNKINLPSRTMLLILILTTIIQPIIALQNSLAIAGKAPDLFEYNFMKEVQVARVDKCFEELPVIYNETVMYLTPKTRILKKYGTEMACNGVFPQLYKIEDGWYQIQEKIVMVKDPENLAPMTEGTWEYEKPSSLAVTGIYTQDDLNKLSDRIMFPIEKEALVTEIAHEMEMSPNSAGKKGILRWMSEDSIIEIATGAWKKFWNKVSILGNISAGFIALYAIFQVIGLVLEALTNSYLLHRTYGWSIHMLGAVWNGLANLLLYLAAQNQENEQAARVEEQQEEVRQEQEYHYTPT